PIKGATVTLYQVPEWSARTGPADTDENTCESNESRGNGAWSQAAPQEMGVQADSNISLMSPTASSQVTGADGYYGWDVGPGCWYVVVSAPGYASRVSPVVGVPSEVTDLDIQLIQATAKVYLPMVTR
ncbi:MAG TPA: carboxypeptidase-like regulatory domain-containing protein, partial [Herpetosiphonaceae bacterium]|nr:carboxypeptidase-like regulatory domain-containing protein [Herpetosiphonaceae bacterium]